MRLPFVVKPGAPIFRRVGDQPWLPVAAVALAVLMGAAMGAAMASGGAAGQVLWSRLSRGSGDGDSGSSFGDN